MSSGVTFDSGALIAFERGRREVVALVSRALDRRVSIAVPAGALAQVWRDGARQVRLARLLASPAVDVVGMDDHTARAIGQLLGVSGTSDVIDASVVWCARERQHAVVTSDPDDLRMIDAGLRIVPC